MAIWGSKWTQNLSVWFESLDFFYHCRADRNFNETQTSLQTFKNISTRYCTSASHMWPKKLIFVSFHSHHPSEGGRETAQGRQHYRQNRERQVKSPPTGKPLNEQAVIMMTTLTFGPVRQWTPVVTSKCGWARSSTSISPTSGYSAAPPSYLA